MQERHGSQNRAEGRLARPRPADSRVITMADFRAARRFRAPGLVESYWEALRAGRPAPARAELDPRGMEDALEYAFILERIAPRQGRLRIAGRHLCDLAGTEVRGAPLSALFAPESRAALGAALAAVCDDPAAAILTVGAARGIGRPGLEGRLLLLPLLDREGRRSRLLGCLETEGRLGRTPRRLTVEETDLRPIPVARRDAPLAAGLAEPAAPYDAPRARGRPQLRLVKSERDG